MGVSDVGDKIMLLKTIRCWRRFGDFGEMLITCEMYLKYFSEMKNGLCISGC